MLLRFTLILLLATPVFASRAVEQAIGDHGKGRLINASSFPLQGAGYLKIFHCCSILIYLKFNVGSNGKCSGIGIVTVIHVLS